MFSIETESLILRDMLEQDEGAFVAISQDDKYQRFYSEEDCAPEKYIELTHLFISQAKTLPRMEYQLAIEYKESSSFIGTVCLRLEKDNQASMGCGLAREYQGKGLIKEAVASLAEFGFSELNVHRIHVEIVSSNKAAIDLCKKLGMREEALFKEHRFFKGQWWDTVVLAILNSEWSSHA